MTVRLTVPSDFSQIIALTRAIYPSSEPWSLEQLGSHQRVFPDGQFVAVEPGTGRLLGMAASLVIVWDDYEHRGSWREFTASGTFSNHDPANGRTLYGAEVMVAPDLQGRGVGSALYDARRALAVRRGLLRIRAGARLRGYGAVAADMSPDEYVLQVIRHERVDPTLTFQLKRGFHVIDVVQGYLRHDPESLGHAAVIQWLNPTIANPSDYRAANPVFEPFLPGHTPPP